MIIGVDGLPLAGKKTGVGYYLISILRKYVAQYPSVKFVLFSNKEILLPKDLESYCSIVGPAKGMFFFKAILWLKLYSPFLIRKYKLDFYIGSYNFLPFFIPRLQKVLVVHDLNYLIVPKTMSRGQYIVNKLFLKKDIARADAIITNSKGTADKILKYFNVQVDSIIHPSRNNEDLNIKENELDTINRLGGKFPYILALSTIEPRKNLKFVIRAFLDLKSTNLIPDLKLVLVGHGGWKSSDVHQLISKNSEDIKYLGFVPDDCIPSLYRNANLFVFPSLYEGFGMPVREAILYNIPVIASDLQELREAGGGRVFYIDPNDLEGFKRCILDVIIGGARPEGAFPEEMDMLLNLEQRLDFFKGKE